MVKFTKLGNGIPVVVDVLRATSTITVALDCGIQKVIPINGLKNIDYYKKNDYLLIGEKNGIKIKGFDLGNSPSRIFNFLTQAEKEYKNMVIKTTNATNILCTIQEAFLVSSINLEFAKEKLSKRDISVIMCGGNYGLREDMIVGISLYGSIYGNISIDNDAINSNILESKARKHLEDLGYIDDVKFIVNNINAFKILPRLKRGQILSN